MATFVKADSVVLGLVSSVMQECHPELVEAGVEVTALMAVGRVDPDTGETVGAPLKHAGYPALATISIANPKYQAVGCKDALLLIDAGEWTEMSRDQQIALIDHELTHLEVVRDAEGQVAVNDNTGRPKLKTRKHDWQIGGFSEVVERRGESAIELMQVASVLSNESPVKEKIKQLSLFE